MTKEKQFVSLFYLKHKNWYYEKEYRIISYDNLDFIELPIKSIYFGMNASDEHINLIKKLIKDRDIKLYKMKPNIKNLYFLLYIEFF